jgi:hypothetical protein
MLSIYLIPLTALGPWIYHLTEMNTSNTEIKVFLERKALPAHEEDKLTAICELVAYTV